MRLHDLSPHLYESRGFVARRSGDEYVDPTNRSDVATFKGLTLLPSSGAAYDSFDGMMSAFKEWKANADGKVYEINTPIRSMASAMVVNMDTRRGPEHYVLFTKDLNRMEGKLINIPANVIPNHGGYVMNRDVSTSERSGLKPAEIVRSSSPLNANQVPTLLDAARPTAGDAAVDQMQDYLRALISGKGDGYVIRGGAANAKLHQKYLGEWASPIAMMTGQFESGSSLEEIQDVMTRGQSIGSAKIVYNTNPAEALFDSSLVVKPYEIMISTKAKTGGAAASLKGLNDAMNKKADDFPEGFWDDSKASRFRDIVKTIMTKSAIDGVLDAATSEGIIDSSDAARIKSGLSVSDKGRFEPTPAISDLMGNYAANSNHPMYDPAKHALASVARALTDKLNDEDFTDIVKQVLNHANVVQMYFHAVVKGEDLLCKGFELVWPPRFVGDIKFYSGKSFSATEIKGRLGFKIGTGAKMIDDPDESLKVSFTDSQERRAQRAAVKAKELSVGKITKSGERDVRDVDVPDVVALGREKKA